MYTATVEENGGHTVAIGSFPWFLEQMMQSVFCLA